MEPRYKRVDCSRCGGTKKETCFWCGGSGKTKDDSDNIHEHNIVNNAVDCSFCNGTGWVDCRNCGGNGYMLRLNN